MPSAKLARRLSTLIVFLLAVASATILVGQNAPPDSEEEKATNLKVLDPAMSHDELMDVMGKFTVALGVHCDHCHAAKGGPDSHEMDFASDSVPAKDIARAMMKMTSAINGDYLSKLGRDKTSMVTVECVTCHRGQSRPRQIQDVLAEARATGGMKALDSVYRNLREHYYGRHTFDFGEHILPHLANSISEASDSDALAILQINKEFNPKSAMTERMMGQILLSMGDTTGAISAFERALVINPNSRRVKEALETLRPKK